MITIPSSFNWLNYFKDFKAGFWWIALLLSLIIFKDLIKLRCINRIKDINKNAKGAFPLLFFKEAFFVLLSRG